jgi:catechol 2,3-dioxygenase-like lactoylglutathione lyase family enzyme
MQLKFISIIVSDQEKALKFYTTVLGFRKMADLPMGPYRWLTVVSPDGIDGVELSIEPAAFPPAQAYQKACFEAGIPLLALTTKDVQTDLFRLRKEGVVFHGEPVKDGMVTLVRFEDTCGNLVLLVQPDA